MMQVNELLPFRKGLTDQGVILCYNGYMTEEILSGIGATIKHKMAARNTDKNVARGLFSLFVEQMQNVIRYSVEKETSELGGSTLTLRYGLLVVGMEADHHFVACGNMVDRKDVATLRNNLTHIKSLGQEELKDLFRSTLKGETPAGSLGAGVGFIDIARRATRGFDFDFTDVDDALTYFSIKAYI
ncbi:MAG: SiaB family protein kinase [Magnetococcus sp. YQC-3]